MFISFAGPRGSGKTTQCELLAARLRATGTSCHIVKALDESAKEKCLSLIDDSDQTAKMLLHCMLYRRQTATISRYLSDGCAVLADRFLEHFRFYHQYEGLLAANQDQAYRILESLVFEGLRPDAIVFLDVDLETANARVHRRTATGSRHDYMLETEVSHRNLLRFYTQEVPYSNVRIVDARGHAATVHKRIIEALALRDGV